MGIFDTYVKVDGYLFMVSVNNRALTIFGNLYKIIRVEMFSNYLLFLSCDSILNKQSVKTLKN